MKFNAETSISGDQMLLALSESGCQVSHVQLREWRRDGLLPALATRGLGPGKGKSFWWNEKNVIAQAQCVHDLLIRHGDRFIVTLILWLCGYPILMAKVRRAWLRRSNRPKAWQLRTASGIGKQDAQAGPFSLARDRTDTALLKTVLTLCGSFIAGHRSESEELYETLHRATEALGYTAETSNEAQYRLFNTLSVVLSTIESSSLLNGASDKDMASARNLAAASVRLVQALTAEGTDKACPIETARLMGVLGPPLFLCTLLLQRTGYDDHLCKSLAALECLQATIIETARSDRDQLLESFRGQLAEIWSAAPAAPKNEEAPILASSVTGRMGGLGLCLGFVFGLPARLCANDVTGLLTAIPV